MTATGSPGEEFLDSADAGPRPRSRPWLAVVAVVLALLAALFGIQALQPDPVADQAESTASSFGVDTATPADPSLVDASARRLYGELEPEGLQNFSTAVRAANDVVRLLCRAEIPSWAASLISSGNSYDQAIFLMSPANRAFGTFVVQVELTWSVDHYAYAVVAGHVERCV